MKKTLLVILPFIFWAATIRADTGDAGYAGTFMRSGVSARSLGMGGAYTAVAEGPEATYFNPAGLAFNLKLGVGLSYKVMSLDRHLGDIAVSFPIRGEAAMAASWINAGVSNLTGTGSSRQPTGNINNSMNAFALSFAKALDSSIAFGGSLRYLQEKYDTPNAFSIGVDIGFLLRLKKLISIGGLVQNLGSTYRWDTSDYWDGGTAYDEKLPVVMRFGLAGHLLSNTLVPAIDFEKSNKMALRFRAGAEYWFVKTITRRSEDEYEEGKINLFQEQVRWAGLRLGIDRGSPTFGASYFYNMKTIAVGLEYAYLVGQAGTQASHFFTLKFGF
jgi:hypothetical protein